MKLILLLFIQMCLIVEVLSDAKRPGPPPCGKYNPCLPGYKCEYGICVRDIPATTTKKPTTTTKKPKPTTPKKKPCCYSGNRRSSCYYCRPPFQCYKGLYCQYLPPPTTTKKPTTTPKPPQPCNKYNHCPPGYKCQYKICVPIPTTTTKKPTPPKPRQCCWFGNYFINCFYCFPPYICIQGYCKYYVPPNKPPTTTPKPPTTCNDYKKCPSGYECEYNGINFKRMHLSSILIILPILFSSILTQQIPNCQTRIFQCDADWDTRTDPNTGDVYGYKAFIVNKMNFYEADVFCRARCAEVVSIHSQEEQNFVRRIAAPVLNRCQFTSACAPVVQSSNGTFDRQLRSFWIGLNRVTGTLKDAHSVDSSVYQLWSDRTEVDFGAYPNNSVNSNTNSPPWTRGNPNGVNSADPQIIEDCTQMVESRQGGWNDFPCNWRISGVICKRKCTSYCAAQDV